MRGPYLRCHDRARRCRRRPTSRSVCLLPGTDRKSRGSDPAPSARRQSLGWESNPFAVSERTWTGPEIESTPGGNLQVVAWVGIAVGFVDATLGNGTFTHIHRLVPAVKGLERACFIVGKHLLPDVSCISDKPN